MEALEQAKEPSIPELLSRYLARRSEERVDWTAKGRLKGTVGDFHKVQEALGFLQEKEISTVESLDAYLDETSGKVLAARREMKKSEKQVKTIDTILSHIDHYKTGKPVRAEYAAIRWKGKKEAFAAAHREELDAYNAAIRYFKANPDAKSYRVQDLKAKRQELSEIVTGKKGELETVQEEVKVLRDVRHWLNQVLPPEQRRATAEPGKKPSVTEQLAWTQEAARNREAQKQPIQKKQQDMEL